MTTLELTATSVHHRLRLVVDIELPPDVPDGEHRVTVAIQTSIAPTAEPEQDTVRRVLLDAGVIRPMVLTGSPEPPTDERLAAIAEQGSGIPSLSECVIADREDRA